MAAVGVALARLRAPIAQASRRHFYARHTSVAFTVVRYASSTTHAGAPSKYAFAETAMPPPSPGRGYLGRSANFDVTEHRESFERWAWLLKLLGYMNEDDRLFTDSNRVFQSCVNQTAIRDFYRALQLAPTFRGQQALLMAHVWMVHRRLSQEGDEGKLMQELVFDRLWEETLVRIRYMNVSEMTVSKHLAEVQQVCFNACIAYDKGIKDSDQAAFQTAIAKHLLDDESPPKQRVASKLAEYMRRELKNLDKVDAKYILKGTIPWGKPVELAAGTPPLADADEYTLIGEKVGNWRASLDNRGKLYYWNLTTRFSVWDRPTGDDLLKGLEKETQHQ
jgi:cytochrome b pre-mRNA-processing protein 3